MSVAWPTGVQLLFFFFLAPVFQWCCSTPQGSAGVGRNMFLSSPHLCFITVFIGYLFVSREFMYLVISRLVLKQDVGSDCISS